MKNSLLIDTATQLSDDEAGGMVDIGKPLRMILNSSFRIS